MAAGSPSGSQRWPVGVEWSASTPRSRNGSSMSRSPRRWRGHQETTCTIRAASEGRPSESALARGFSFAAIADRIMGRLPGRWRHAGQGWQTIRERSHVRDRPRPRWSTANPRRAPSHFMGLLPARRSRPAGSTGDFACRHPRIGLRRLRSGPRLICLKDGKHLIIPLE